MQYSFFDLDTILETKPITNERDRLFFKYSQKLRINRDLNRSIVSFQYNKNIPFYRWFKFKEGFSTNLVKYFILHYQNSTSSRILNVLDPFSGIGTTVTTALENGHYATGIEILPVGIEVTQARIIAHSIDIKQFDKYFNKLILFLDEKEDIQPQFRFPHLKITQNAFPSETEKAISLYLDFINIIEEERVKSLFRFACFAILEEVSYTSKDGQYLRWDNRSGRKLKSKYYKKNIYEFNEAILRKLEVIRSDLQKRNGGDFGERAKIIQSSSLECLPDFKECIFDLVITSPPYCNRYDYTRTYALELAFLGLDELEIKKLRQQLLSSTVENRTKRDYLNQLYQRLNRVEFYEKVVNTFEQQMALQEVLSLLYRARDQKILNNTNIPVMVENYFFEMNFIIHELARILKPGGKIYMVNDNVQYAGEEIPVDLILSDFAESAGLIVEHIWVLPRGKGNSSQQMGEFGRKEIRKCVYVWGKPE